MAYVLALDQGTTSSRAILFDEAGAIAAVAQKEFQQFYPQAGWVEHDPAEILSSQMSCAAEVLARVIARPRKIAAIGIHVSRGITTHGFAFNVTTDLCDFGLIVPCGIPDHAVTSLELEGSRPEELPELEAVAHRAAREFGLVFEQQVLAVESLAALRAQAGAATAVGPEFPAEDTPLRIPAEVERLRGNEGRPILT